VIAISATLAAPSITAITITVTITTASISAITIASAAITAITAATTIATAPSISIASASIATIATVRTRGRAVRQRGYEHHAAGGSAHILSQIIHLEGALFTPEKLDGFRDRLGAGIRDELCGL